MYATDAAQEVRLVFHTDRCIPVFWEDEEQSVIILVPDAEKLERYLLPLFKLRSLCVHDCCYGILNAGSWVVDDRGISCVPGPTVDDPSDIVHLGSFCQLFLVAIRPHSGSSILVLALRMALRLQAGSREA